MQVYLVRHTAVEVPSGFCYGRTDVALRSRFLFDFQQIKQKIPFNQQTTVFSSPSGRCRELAAFMSSEYILDERLLEMDFGDWEGKNWNAVEAEEWFKDYVNVAPPNGESMLDLYSRVEDFIAFLRKSRYESVVVVTHAGVLRCVLAVILGIPLTQVFKVKLNFGQIIKLTISENMDFDELVLE